MEVLDGQRTIDDNTSLDLGVESSGLEGHGTINSPCNMWNVSRNMELAKGVSRSIAALGVAGLGTC
jgi:hypothetical protein